MLRLLIRKYYIYLDRLLNVCAKHIRLDIPTTRLRKYGNKRFSWRGATLWNKLPQSIRKEDISITTFKYKLKELFKRSPLKYHISNPL